MREIKFRAWDGMKYVCSFTKKGEDRMGWFFSAMPGFKKEQFTGLLDKNGKEIYEGDIVKVDDDYESVGFMSGEIRGVYFLDGGYRLKLKRAGQGRGHWLDDAGNLEVIGNIHENPELLECKP